ncbi:transcription activator of gluconeogenesis ERT1 [Schizophyllum commune Tattone D]|nr:transcription activator of gluconeogenesis ERT1 [Schizophyllum commune Tattone D]
MSTVHVVAPVAVHSVPPAQLLPQTATPPAYAQTLGGEAASTLAQKKKSPPLSANKRKRSETADDSTDQESNTPSRKSRDGPKKKKANRACFHCQKAHLTCDDSRPCQRCIKRGIANNCTEGHRKKAKYLLDDEELEELKRKQNTVPSRKSEPRTEKPKPSEPPVLAAQAPAAPQPQPSLQAQAQPVPITAPGPIPASTSEPFAPNDPMFNLTFDSNFPFGSEAANLEYTILSAILGNPSPPDTTSPPPQPYPWPSDTLSFNSPQLDSFSPFPENVLPVISADNLLSSTGSLNYLQARTAKQQSTADPADLHCGDDASKYTRDGRCSSPSSFYMDKESAARTLLSPPPTDSPGSATSTVPLNEVGPFPRPGSHLQSITDRVKVPYDYTEGYHFLMKHLTTRFEKNDILRIVRALAIFRPSLIALQMPLSWDDEVFVERCFQRSLLELDKLISYSGTPTVVWRRTGEICLVAPEFCMLTEWSMEELMGQKKYIYELFENQSVVEYWENFAEHAFENTTQSVYSHCVLLKPSGAPVPATFCFSIRRDLFDLPSAVIGQWLPLL